jgi:hypothetical protein
MSSQKQKKEMEVIPGVVTKNFSPEIQKSLEIFKGEDHVIRSIINNILNDKVPGIEKKIDPKSGEYVYGFAPGKKEMAEDAFDAIAMKSELSRVKVAKKIENLGISRLTDKIDEREKLGTESITTNAKPVQVEPLARLKQHFSEDVLNLVDSLNYSHDERREIFKAIRSGNVPGIRVKKDEVGIPVYDFAGTKESAREAYREVAFNAMEEVVKKYHSSELAKSGF